MSLKKLVMLSQGKPLATEAESGLSAKPSACLPGRGRLGERTQLLTVGPTLFLHQEKTESQRDTHISRPKSHVP